MKRLKFSLPLFSIVPISIGVLMVFSFFIILNALRFIQCSSWDLLQKPPENATVLLGTLHNRLYVETENASVYCLQQNQWSKCALPPYKLQPDMAPSWLIGKLETTFQIGGILQVMRSGSFSDVVYYSLLVDRQVFTCSTNFSIEIENIFRSGLFVWLLLPTIAIIWSVVSFAAIFIKHGQPVLWDFWGKGERIK